uniref:Uncharacterized protein n=1 Tax=Lactuca sativa TaxID=4236 RepID=A0A9R1XUE8_LACSA|nr:hypothetical protein LSAT_V11C100032260 [Lactuca sativa]
MEAQELVFCHHPTNDPSRGFDLHFHPTIPRIHQAMDVDIFKKGVRMLMLSNLPKIKQLIVDGNFLRFRHVIYTMLTSYRIFHCCTLSLAKSIRTVMLFIKLLLGCLPSLQSITIKVSAAGDAQLRLNVAKF